MPAPFEIRILTIDPVSWTPITIPFNCTNLAIKNKDQANAVRLRTSSGDSSTEDLIGPGAEQTLAVPFPRYRFVSGTQPMWLQATAGTGPVVVKFLV